MYKLWSSFDIFKRICIGPFIDISNIKGWLVGTDFISLSYYFGYMRYMRPLVTFKSSLISVHFGMNKVKAKICFWSIFFGNYYLVYLIDFVYALIFRNFIYWFWNCTLWRFMFQRKKSRIKSFRKIYQTLLLIYNKITRYGEHIQGVPYFEYKRKREI